MKGNFKDLTGKQFGRLTVIERIKHNNTLGYWICKCECGNEKIVPTNRLTQGMTKSCGCLNHDLVIERSTVHGLRHTRLYRIWNGMKQRCHNENHPRFKDWGGRGIKVCDEWKQSFKTFYDWSIQNGYSDNLSIDRINNNGNYDPNNCRWSTVQEQNKNKRKYNSKE